MGSHTFVGERLDELKSSLQATVVDQRYTAENYLDMSDKREIGNGGTVVREHKGGTAKKLVLDDAGFWQRVRRHVGLTMPICKLLRRHDSAAPSVGKVYHGWFEVGESIDSTALRCPMPRQPKISTISAGFMRIAHSLLQRMCLTQSS